MDTCTMYISFRTLIHVHVYIWAEFVDKLILGLGFFNIIKYWKWYMSVSVILLWYIISSMFVGESCQVFLHMDNQ
jgi:hypothetical protein